LPTFEKGLAVSPAVPKLTPDTSPSPVTDSKILNQGGSVVPLVPIIAAGEKPFSMFIDFKVTYYWVLDVLEYPSSDALKKVLEQAIIMPALEKHRKIMQHRLAAVQRRHVSAY
jgi:hypothetical protein